MDSIKRDEKLDKHKGEWVYMVHFDEPYHHAKHYIGSTNSLGQRLQNHFIGRHETATLMKVIRKAGISFSIARVWKGDITDERTLKNRRESPRLCPICSNRTKKIQGLTDVPAFIVRGLIQDYFNESQLNQLMRNIE